jgi:hypothetical protein
METGSNEENFREKGQPKLPYSPPQLTSLGQIQAIVQRGRMVGADGGGFTTSISS